MKSRRLYSIMIAALLAAILASYWTIRANRKARDHAWAIGVLNPATGASATHGAEGLAGAQLGLREWNQRGLTPSISYIVEDTHSKPVDAVSASRKLIDIDKTSIIIGWLSSSDALAVAPVCDRAGVLFLAIGTSSPELSGAGHFVFRHAPLAPAQADAAARYMSRSVRPKKLGVLYMNDATGEGYYRAFLESAARLGLRPTVVEEYEKTATDFRTQILKLKGGECDAIYVPCVPRSLGQILRQSRELSYSPTVVSNFGAEGQELLDIASEAAEGLVFTSFAMSEDFVAKYRNEYHRSPQMLAALAYDSVKVLFAAMAQAGQNPSKVADFLMRMPVAHGATGTISFDDKHDAIKDVILKTVRNGAFCPMKE